MVLALALPGAMAALTLNAATPSEVNICDPGKFIVYANNTGSTASNLAINVTLPAGFTYDPGSVHISFPVSNQSTQEPVIFQQFLNWTNTSWILGNNQFLKIEFKLTAGCGAPSGRRLSVRADYRGGVPTPYSSLAIVVNQGLLKVTKEPNVIEAGKWDTVKWTVKIENLGSGPAFNVLVNDTNATGLKLLSIDSPGGLLNWSYARIDPGEVKTVNTTFRVIACSNLVNLVNVSWGCGTNDCQKTYAKGSVKFIYYVPDVDFTFNPTSFVVPYCNNTSVSVTVKNTGANNATNYQMSFDDFSAPYTITNVSGAQYFENSHTFSLGTINSTRAEPSGGSKTFTFDFGMPFGKCDASGASGVFNVYSSYFGDCGSRWYPPAVQMAYSMDASTIPSISVSKSGNASLYLGDTGTYTLGVSYTSGNCALHTLPKNTIIDHYPANFEVIDAAGGMVNSSNQTIIWRDEPLNDITPWSKVVQLKASKDDTNCSCGNVYINEFNVSAGENCCGCPLYAETSFPIIVKCFNDRVLSSSNKTATPILQENCRLISYNNTYVFNNTKGLNWSNISFNEQGANSQTFPDLSNSGNATFTVNHTCINESSITLNTAKNLDFLNDSCGRLENKTILQINYTLRQPQTGSFVDWSRLCVDGYNPDCPNVGCFQDAVGVSVNPADYSISMQLPCSVSACRLLYVTINLTKNSPDDDPKWIAHDLNVTYNDASYHYIGPARIKDIVNQSGPVLDFEPTPIGNDLTWELGKNVSRGGSITFKVQGMCHATSRSFSQLKYIDNCGALVTSRSDCSPGLEKLANITLAITPEVIYALDRNASWKIYVRNTGSDIAYNVTVVDYLESGLNYTSSKISRCPACPLVEEPLNTTVIGHNPCGPDKVVWNIGNMTQKAEVIIEVNGTLCGCLNRNNIAYANISCGGGLPCQNLSDSSRVELVDAQLLVAKHEAGKVDDCKANDPFSIEVRNTAAYVYNLSIKEILPTGLKLNDTPVVSGAVPTSFDNSNPAILIWWFNQTQGISPGTKITIKFNASVKGSCSFGGGDSTVRLNYIEPCGRFGPEVESQIPVTKFSPKITIIKIPSTSYANVGQIVRWNITLKSEGDYVAKNVTLRDILPTNTIWHSSYPLHDSGSGSLSDPLVWKLADMEIGSTRYILVNATVLSCTVPTKNIAKVNWTCCPTSPAVATADLITRPSGSASPDIGQLTLIDTCGGNITLTISNSGATALVYNISDVLPIGFIYKKNSAFITSNNVTHTITIYEPNDFIALNGTLIWNATNIDRVYPNEVITIKFKVINCTDCCKSTTSSTNTLKFNYKDSCGNLLSTTPNIQPVIPKKGDLVVRKEPAVQFQGQVSWTIYIDNSGTKTAENVSVVDTLGDGFFDVTSSNGTVTHNQPLPNWTTIRWTGQKVPMGVGKWSVVVNANSNETCGLTHINNVTVRGTCDTGCIYSNDSAIARALSQATFRLDSLESLLRGQTYTISSFESLLKNSSLDANASREFLASFDDLSWRQQLGLKDFEGLVWCNWNDLDEVQKIRFTSSFEDLLRRQAEIISSNDVLLIRSYCKLNGSEKAVFLSNYEDRLHKEQYLLNGFSKWLNSQSALNNTEKQTWYKFLASYEDLIRRQARLIGSFQELLYSSCQGTFMEVYKSTNKTDSSSNAGEPINYTIIVNNTGSKTIENITINDSILGVIQSTPGITLAPGTNKTYYKVVSHNCSYCSSCTCRICNYALACADVVMDASNRTHLCVASNEVCINITEPNLAPIYPG
ncbi:MAG: hypothetical protein NTX42_01655 [Methanothrix sp.]|nr:hypothetical protein [Methanothrix sp.]